MKTIIEQLVRRLILLCFALTGTILLIVITLITYQENPEVKEVIKQEDLLMEWNPEKLILTNSSVTEEVRKGYYLVSESFKYMGPLAKNPELRYAGNNLSCTNCHLNGGTLSGSASWIGIVDRFPQFGGRANKMGTLEDRINGCMERSMNGKAFPSDAPQLKAMIAYMRWLDEGIPKLNTKVFKGYPNIEIPAIVFGIFHNKVG